VRWDIQGFSGLADVYLSPRLEPSGPTSDRVRIRAKPGPVRSIIVSAPDRKALGYPTGTYYLCFFAFTPFSAQVSTTEEKLNKRADAYDGEVITQRAAGAGLWYARYTNSALLGKGRIKVTAEGLDLTSGQDPPLIYYRVCGEPEYEGCAMSVEEARGELNTTLVGEATSETVRTAYIDHDPKDCPKGANSCTYLISVNNQHPEIRIISLAVEGFFEKTSEVKLDKDYQNIIGQGKYFRYVINPVRNLEFQNHIKKLTITLKS